MPSRRAGGLEVRHGGLFTACSFPLLQGSSGQWGLISGASSAGFSLGQTASAHTSARSLLPSGCHRTLILPPSSLRGLLG